MTWSVMLVGLPPADANSKLRHCKKKVQKVTDIPKRWVLSVKQFEGFRQKKNRNIILDVSQRPSGIQAPKTRQLNKALVNSKK